MAKRKGQDHVIQVPHLGVRVVVTRKKKTDIPGAAAYTRYVCSGEYQIVTTLPTKGPKSASNLVHEIIHVLQYVVEDHNMTFEKEREHLAYIAGYLFTKICEL